MGKHNAYPKELEDFIRSEAEGKTARELAKICNEKFGTAFTDATMKNFKSNHKIRSGREHLRGMKTETELFPKEILRYIMENFRGTGPKEMTERLNERFGTGYTRGQIKALFHNRGLDSGLTGYFESGFVPPNKGKKGFYAPGCEKGWFGKGHIPVNKLPIGSVLKKSDGYLWRKIGEGCRDWKQEHILRWEEANGPVPEGHCITFLDGDRENVDLSNLAVISRNENLALLRMKLRSEIPEVTETGILIARLYSEKQKRKKKRRENENNT